MYYISVILFIFLQTLSLCSGVSSPIPNLSSPHCEYYMGLETIKIDVGWPICGKTEDKLRAEIEKNPKCKKYDIKTCCDVGILIITGASKDIAMQYIEPQYFTPLKCNMCPSTKRDACRMVKNKCNGHKVDCKGLSNIL